MNKKIVQTAGREQLAAGRAQLESGERALRAGFAERSSGEKELNAAEAAYPRHLQELEEAQRELDERTHEARAGLALSDVRRAVVMAEILGKPRALQRRK